MSILRMLRAIPPGLCIIHCSAGIGRTGTVILIDAIIARLLKGQNSCVKEMFQSLRNQRASAVRKFFPNLRFIRILLIQKPKLNIVSFTPVFLNIFE